MRNIDFSPLSRSSIGFERWFERLDEAARAPEGDAGYPPHNIKKIGEEGYRLELALAGFSPEELSIRVERDGLIIAGRKPFPPDRKFLYESIAARSFERRFGLADLVEVKGAEFINGILSIDFLRRPPVAKAPCRIAIATTTVE